jgi:RimJ/RimL family protein N-acetyltransferase
MNISKVTYDEVFLHRSRIWLSDKEMRRLTGAPKLNTKEQRDWFNGLSCNKSYIIYGIVADDIPVGAFGLKNISSHEAEYWGYIGEKKYWGKGIGKWMLDESVKEARIMNIKQIWLRVYLYNERAIKAYERFGFDTTSNDGQSQLMCKNI